MRNRSILMLAAAALAIASMAGCTGAPKQEVAATANEVTFNTPCGPQEGDTIVDENGNKTVFHDNEETC